MTAVPPELKTSDFDYQLPPELIAQTPTPLRGGSRLLVVPADPSAALDDRWFRDLPSLIPPNDLLIVNTTKVRHARLLGHRLSGAAAEVLLLHPTGDGCWIAMGKPGSALRVGQRIVLGDGIEIETVAVLDGPNRKIRFVGATAEIAMARFGRLPLPPYIARDPTTMDEDRYQTVFATHETSVAAPTAGLHFTQPMLAELERRGILIEHLELDVGPGTFRPVEVGDPRQHPMHSEVYRITDRLARAVALTKSKRAKIWAIGTTVVRALESATTDHGLATGERSTNLLILPGYRFRVVDRLITNFHLPRSTLLMLVSAFAGTDRIREAYRHAIEARYRFYSYGDAMLLARP